MEKEIVVYIKNQQDWNNALQVLEDNGGYKRTWGSQICFRGERPTAMQITNDIPADKSKWFRAIV